MLKLLSFTSAKQLAELRLKMRNLGAEIEKQLYLHAIVRQKSRYERGTPNSGLYAPTCVPLLNSVAYECTFLHFLYKFLKMITFS